MTFEIKDGLLIGRQRNETLRIEAWGRNALRVRATQNPSFSILDWALEDRPEAAQASVVIAGASDAQNAGGSISAPAGSAQITNGSIRALVTAAGKITFYRVGGEHDGSKLLEEYYRDYSVSECRESHCLKIFARQFDAMAGNDYKLTMRFESSDGEKFYGMGQYQQPYMELKGCVLDREQRNSQITIPFVLSSLGYGFLWNSPAVGKTSFGKNFTEWVSEETEQLDYYITADDSPKQIIENYTCVTGRAPDMPDEFLGLWQCRLRYRTQEEILQIAHKYQDLGIHIDVIVIDFFHWPRQGDWCFDKQYWPDPKAMTDELHSMGIKVMVSIWPSVDRKCSHFQEMTDKGYLCRTERGAMQTYDYCGDNVSYDTLNPEARKYVWDICKENYYKYGIDMFWLDNAEPDTAKYDFDNMRYYLGRASKTANVYPKMYAKGFYDGMKNEGVENVVNLVRCAWAGSQKYGTLIWSGDVPSTYESFRDQITAGLSIGIAGIPWWTTDIGGFMQGNVKDPAFLPLLLRWYEFAVFCPILRMHGDREPFDIPNLSDLDFGGGFQHTGQGTELWSYGDEAFEIMKKNLELRYSLKPYLQKIYREAHETGAPLMRAMFLEFPDDEKCWDLKDQYMFGSDYLVAPILTPDTFSRSVYLPAGKWKNIHTGEVLSGMQTVVCDAPIDEIPVFKKD